MQSILDAEKSALFDLLTAVSFCGQVPLPLYSKLAAGSRNPIRPNDKRQPWSIQDWRAPGME